MKNEKDSKEKIQKTSSSSSVVVETIDLTLLPTTSTEPHLVPPRTSRSNITLPATKSELSTNQHVVAQHAAADVFNAIFDETFQRPTTSRQNYSDLPAEERPVGRLAKSQPNLRGPRTDFQVLRATGGLINSTNALHNESFVTNNNSKLSLGGIPPSYSTVLKLGPPATLFDSRTYPSIPFIARQPPPSYAEVHGGWEENPSMVSADSYSLGPNPLYVSCPRCRTIVVSDVHTERSHLSYILSLVLCVCLCWPCCLLPFCLKSCKNTYHFCPTCHYYLGAYRPC